MKTGNTQLLNQQQKFSYEKFVADLDEGIPEVDFSGIDFTKKQLINLSKSVNNYSFVGHIIWGALPIEVDSIIQKVEKKLEINNKKYKFHPANFTLLNSADIRLQLALNNKLYDTYTYDACSTSFDMSGNAIIRTKNVKDDIAILRAVNDGYLNVVKALIANNANIDIQDSNGRNAILYAVRDGHLNITKALITANVNLDIQDYDGNSILSYVLKARNNKAEIIELVLKAGINMDETSINSFSEEYREVIGNDNTIKELISIIKVVNLLLCDGAANIGVVLSKEKNCDIFLTRYKNIAIKNGFTGNDFYFYIDALNENNFIPTKIKEIMLNFLRQAEEDFNLECISIFHKIFGVMPCPILDLIEFKQEENKSVKFPQNNNNNQTIFAEAQNLLKLIDFYQQYFHFSEDLKKCFDSTILNDRQVATIKKEITLANIKILNENYGYSLGNNFSIEIEILCKLPLPIKLNHLLFDALHIQSKGILNDHMDCEELNDHGQNDLVKLIELNEIEVNNVDTIF